MEHRVLKIDRWPRGQGLLEATVVLILITLFIGGIIQIWFWGNKQILKRQKYYNVSRILAGTGRDKYQLQWPLVYGRDSLSENQVLRDAPRLRGE
ncbi:MAG: hypothetical protein A3G38_02040 [Omnitrophica WOR_2 bacterium RIFCSPLOWO2_12_FULL_51_8]|nr:MAG: hypothetical protein A3G38_02040 [Omnitrophica WOR_2 bacterium RIFCSPLOWO2_12_FULL_51_8]